MADWARKANEWCLSLDLTSAFRAVAKWYFDLIKNVFVVVGLWYAWIKTGVEIVAKVATLTFAVFVLYIFSYPLGGLYAILDYHHKSRSSFLSLLIAIVSAIAFYGLVFAIGMAALRVFAALFNAQGPIK